MAAIGACFGEAANTGATFRFSPVLPPPPSGDQRHLLGLPCIEDRADLSIFQRLALASRRARLTFEAVAGEPRAPDIGAPFMVISVS